MVHLRSRDIPPRREVLLELVEGEQRFFRGICPHCQLMTEHPEPLRDGDLISCIRCLNRLTARKRPPVVT
jgi:uncharacterized paraquat-inducible protein A